MKARPGSEGGQCREAPDSCCPRSQSLLAGSVTARSLVVTHREALGSVRPASPGFPGTSGELPMVGPPTLQTLQVCCALMGSKASSHPISHTLPSRPHLHLFSPPSSHFSLTMEFSGSVHAKPGGHCAHLPASSWVTSLYGKGLPGDHIPRLHH